MHGKTVITNGSVILPDGVKKADVELCGGIITRVDRQIPADKSSVVIDAEGKYVLPGFIDIHTNGIGGFDLTNGVYSPERNNFDSSEEAYLRGLDRALGKYARTGVTRAILTSMASPVPDLKRVFHYVSKYTNASNRPPWSEVIGGLYIEGTFMKLVDYRGAHNPDYFHEPSGRLFEELQEAADGLIKVVNVVPEWEEPAFDLIKYLTGKDIVCAAGHTGATGDQYRRGIKNGMRLAIHFPNGPTGSSVKPFHGGGAVESVLQADGVFVEIIADGYHVDKSYVMDIMKRKGFDKVVVITDSMFPTLLEGIQKFSMFGVEGRVSSNGRYLQIADRGNALFGSTLTIDSAFSNVLNWLTSQIEGVWSRTHEPMSFEEALLRTSAMCTRNPARVLGIFEPGGMKGVGGAAHCTGSIETGKCADIVVAGIEECMNQYRLNIDRVFVKGESL